MLVKALLQGSFSLMVFGWSQILMDVQPLMAMITGAGKLHGFTHTYVGATLLAILSALSGKYLAQWAMVSLLSAAPVIIRWWVAFLSAFIGTYSHVALDSVMHRDIQPLLPWSSSNELLGIITVPALHQVCLYSGLIGAVIYLMVIKFQGRYNSALKTDVSKGTRP